MTPPSRSHTGGDSTSARLSRSWSPGKLCSRAESARPRGQERHPRQDALHVADGLQEFAQANLPGPFQQAGYGVMARPQHVLIAQRRLEPALEPAAAHGRDGAVHEMSEGVLGASGEALVDF